MTLNARAGTDFNAGSLIVGWDTSGIANVSTTMVSAICDGVTAQSIWNVDKGAVLGVTFVEVVDWDIDTVKRQTFGRQRLWVCCWHGRRHHAKGQGDKTTVGLTT